MEVSAQPDGNVLLSIKVIYCQVQRVGPSFSSYFKGLQVRKGSDEQLIKCNSDDHLSDSEDFHVDIEFLRSLDPKEWRDQDHYAVLGLKKARINASEDDIRRAYRKMVLMHHPDKRKAKGEEINADDDYFTCITKAYEILGNCKTRRSYDSVDAEFDDSLPTIGDIEKNFFRVFQKYFTLNARWSEKKNVPFLGTEDSTRKEVDDFYTFWYDFESWREFSYLDEEDKEKGQDREERRWIEKQNKIARIKRKKEEMSRIRALVDLSYNNDPRILKFKQQDKDRKLAAKRAKMDAVQAAKAEEERILKEAQLAKDKAEQAEQKRIEQIRIEKEYQKKNLKKERKLLRDKVKENNYYSSNDSEKIKNMEGVEKICETLKLLELQQLNRELEKGDKNIFFQILEETERKIQLEHEIRLPNNNISVKSPDSNATWNSENMQLLIKAVNLFPAGTSQRWEVIATFMNQHCVTAIEKTFSAKDVLNKAKDLQGSDFSKSFLKSLVSDSAYESFEKNKKDLKKKDKDDVTINSDNVKLSENCTLNTGKEVIIDGTSNNLNNIGVKQPASKLWTKDEQALLEQAIKTYPLSTHDRWDRISECIPNRSKKDCLKRVKELVERVNAKKEAKLACK